MPELKDKLIVALDVDTLDKARYFVDILYPQVTIFKVGSQLFTACGPEAVKMIAGKGARVFLDLKFHDIPNTVYAAVASATHSAIAIATSSQVTPVFMMTVHTRGGLAMLQAAIKAAKDKAAEFKITRPLVVGVTRLTSDEDKGNIQEEVLEASRLAKNAGLDGVVCSVNEAALVRKEFGKEFIIVTPGIRPKGASVNDQKRVATAKDALAAGSNFLVVGRPILEAKDPLQAVRELI